MCKIFLKSENYETNELFLNTLILNQRGRPFTKEHIIALVEENEGVSETDINTALIHLIRKGLLLRSETKFYVRPMSKGRGVEMEPHSDYAVKA